MSLTFVSLFAGIGGIQAVDLGLERAGHTCVGQVEIDPYARRVLTKHWPDVPKHGDVKTFEGDEFGPFDMLAGGYPCQPFSHAGTRNGDADPRHLWPDVHRIIRNVRPRFVLLENVAGHLSLGFGRVLGDLAESGYDAEWDCIPASAVGASHRRDRVFLVAYPQGEPRDGGTDHVFRRPGPLPEPGDSRSATGPGGAWRLSEPPIRRGIDGLPAELDVIRGVISEEANYPEAKPAAQELVQRIVRDVWQHRELAATSPDVYRQRLHDLVPSVPRERTQSGWLLGPRIENDEELRGLWERVHAQSLEEAHDLLPRLLERIRAQKRPQALGSRVDRLRTLGNAVVPQVAEWIGRRLV